MNKLYMFMAATALFITACPSEDGGNPPDTSSDTGEDTTSDSSFDTASDTGTVTDTDSNTTSDTSDTASDTNTDGVDCLAIADEAECAAEPSCEAVTGTRVEDIDLCQFTQDVYVACIPVEHAITPSPVCLADQGGTVWILSNHALADLLGWPIDDAFDQSCILSAAACAAP